MSRWTSLLALTLPPVLASALLSFQVGQSPPPQPLSLSRPSPDCTEPPTFQPGYQEAEGGLVPQGAGFKFQGVSWLETNLCTSGTLVLSAEGEVAAGEAPQLHIALNSELLSVETFDKQRTQRIKVPGPGRLTLTYFNDYYRADVRVANLYQIRVKNTNCGGIRGVDVPRETGGVWIPEERYAYLVFEVPMTVTPCAAGTLAMRVAGTQAAGVSPILEFRQRGRRLLRLQTREASQQVSLEIGAAPVSIVLTNPYGKLLGDRNLNVHQIQFIPDAGRASSP